MDRLNRKEFFDLLSQADDETLKKTLWTVYWQGPRPVRERLETLLGVPAPPPPPPPDPEEVLEDVKEFASLAHSGAYLAGDRRVSPKERTRWRFTFRDLAERCLELLHSDDEESVRTGIAALTVMIDLVMDTYSYEYFRSEDPVEAARFVVSDAVRAMWLRTRMVFGTSAFAEQASAQLLRWESDYGWTRRGYGWVAERETTLSQVAIEVLETPDMWDEFAVKYVAAITARRASGGKAKRRGHSASYRSLHAALSERLIGSEHEDLIEELKP